MLSFLKYHKGSFLTKLRKIFLIILKKTFPQKYYFIKFKLRLILQSLILFIYYFSPKKSLSKTFFYVGSDKYYNYKELYDILETLLEKKKVNNVLEIGIGGHNMKFGGGQSLSALNFFYSKSSILGIDIIDKSFLDNRRIKTIVGDQADEIFLKEVGDKYGPFDLIIDDGSHFVPHQKKTFKILFDYLNENGVYICEDCGGSYITSFGGDPELSEDNNIITYFSRLTHAVNSECLSKKKIELLNNYKTISKVFFFNKAVLIQKNFKKNNTVQINEMGTDSLEEYNKRIPIMNKKNKRGYVDIIE